MGIVYPSKKKKKSPEKSGSHCSRDVSGCFSLHQPLRGDLRKSRAAPAGVPGHWGAVPRGNTFYRLQHGADTDSGLLSPTPSRAGGLPK